MVRIDPNEDAEDAASVLRQRPEVLYAEPNYIVYADRTPTDPRFGGFSGINISTDGS